MKNANAELGKTLYGILFIIALPLLLWFWAQATEDIIQFSVVKSTLWGMILLCIGGLLMLWGMQAIMVYGKGLPMNAYPPERLVQNGPYKILRHPIYWGFGILVVGMSILLGSSSGLWLVTPVVILSMIALVLGYERLDLAKRFPDPNYETFLELPQMKSEPASVRDRLASLFWVLCLWVLGNWCVSYFGGLVDLFEKPWTFEPILGGGYLFWLSLVFFLGAPLVLEKKQHLREWTLSVLIALSISVFVSLMWPSIRGYYFTFGFTGMGWILSMPVFLVLFSLRAYVIRFRKAAILFLVLGFYFSAFLFVNSWIPDTHLVTAMAIFLLAVYHLQVWNLLKNLSEKIANSWKEWVLGPVRVINHGFYVGIGAFVCILGAGWLAGNAYAWAILVFTLVALVFAALWAQFIEGSEKLKRPFGYYGSLVGVLFSSLAVWAMGYEVWIIIAVASVFMTWGQAIGRLRCLINGCCHGSRVEDPLIGIRYHHHRSRVCGISGLKGEWLHPTQLYSILWLFLIGFVLLALWQAQMPYSFIFGLYLILTGIGRFVEEAYRGEVQTPIIWGLRLYQWTAIASVAVGIVMTVIPSPLAGITDPGFGWQTLVAALIGGFFTFFAMGVDFPRSNARFSRLV